MSFNRQFFMTPSKVIRSTMPMVIGRVEYEEPIVRPKVKSSYPGAIRKTGVVTVVKQVMNVYDITHNDKASIRFLQVKSTSKARKHKPKYIVEYHYNNPTDISHNDKAAIRFIKPKH